MAIFAIADLMINLEGDTLLIDKPLYITSFGVVKRIRHSFRIVTGKKKYKVGHAGTLDPLATGLMIVCTGKNTKQISQFQDLPKQYTGIIRLGATTTSYDLETEIDKTFDISSITESQLFEVAKSFVGESNQLPPVFSAKKIDGKRAYKYAREGEEVKMKFNKITVHNFEITKINLPEVHFKIDCSKGTYIRSIAHDFGMKLNNGAHLTELRRTKIGSYTVDNAKSIEETKDIIEELKIKA